MDVKTSIELIGIDSWFIAKDNSITEVIKIHPIATGEMDSCSYQAVFKFTVHDNCVQPIIHFVIRSLTVESLSSNLCLYFHNDEISETISSFNIVPEYSIIHKDYVSSHDFLIDENRILQIFENCGVLIIEYNKHKITLIIDKEIIISYLKIKSRLGVGLLTNEQVTIIQKELEREERTKAEIEQNRNRLLHDLSISLATELIKERPVSVNSDVIKRFGDKLELSNPSIKFISESDGHISFEALGASVKLEDVLDCLTKKEVFSSDYLFSQKYNVNKHMSINQAKDLIEDRISYSELQDKWKLDEELERQAELKKQQELIDKQRGLTKARDLELRLDAKVLAKHILTLNRDNSNVYLSPNAWEKYLPQFMDQDHLKETEELLLSRKILERKSGFLVLNEPLFQRCSLQDLESIIDQKTTSEEVISRSPKEGCYIATCVYGSYDCPEVWTLRRFRDQNLDTRWFGRLFIQAYYAISPSLVRLFGRNHWFQSFWRHNLDIFVGKLRDRGYENTPYKDKF